MKIYLVGGAVRDSLLQRSIQERDWVVVGATPSEMLSQGFRQVGKDFPVFLHPETGEEYALARTERKTGKGYTGFTCYADPSVTLEEDLKRRDLTINAMAISEEGILIDPYQGQTDLANKLLRNVSEAFVEDPVRVLRIARFQARFTELGFLIAPTTQQLMEVMVKQGELHNLVAERVWQEFHRALGENSPAEFIRVLRLCGALAVVFPEIDQLFGIPNPAKWHPEIDSGVHSLMVLEQAVKLNADIKTRFAALLHDLGKGITPQSEWPKHKEHEERGVPLIKSLCERLKVPKTFLELAILTSRYHAHVHRAYEITSATLVNTLESLDAFRRPDRFKEFLVACEADARGRTGYEDTPYPQSQLFTQAFLAANAVSIKSLLEKGLSGNAIANALHELRVKAVEKIHKH